MACLQFRVQDESFNVRISDKNDSTNSCLSRNVRGEMIAASVVELVRSSYTSRIKCRDVRIIRGTSEALRGKANAALDMPVRH